MSEKKWFSTLFNRNSASSEAKSVATEEQLKQEKNKKLKAAYALNLCTVSVSQIIDYNDINVLEQEYEAILNNLNLEHIPKDEALLEILKQLLDTITFFRIEEKEKEFVDKEYQQKMKNAIWSAVPNLGMLVAGGSPITMAISLASQVGIGYMNYRKNKAEYTLDREKQLWQLQRSAIEQFNGLRRELFDTSWRLADTYGFPDEYRLTERQITQYNNILMDSDELRKYERLDAIKNNFEAYPPFWYHFGNTANAIAQNPLYHFNETVKENYTQHARDHFDQYINMVSQEHFDILRDDPITSACALEYIDLLDKKADEKKIIELLELAVKKSGNANDILELCAMSHLSLGFKHAEAAGALLRRLVCENYNTTLNAQLLSSIYVFLSGTNEQNKLDARRDYETLERMVAAPRYLFPMPDENNTLDPQKQQKDFFDNQKGIILAKYDTTLRAFRHKYTIKFNKVFPVPNSNKEYSDNYFSNEDSARTERLSQLHRIVESDFKAEDYKRVLAEANIRYGILDVLDDMLRAITQLPFANVNTLKEKIDNKLAETKDSATKLDARLREDTRFTKEHIALLNELNFDVFVSDVFAEIQQNMCQHCESISDMDSLTMSEVALRDFCTENDLPEPEAGIIRSDAAFALENDTRIIDYSKWISAEDATNAKIELAKVEKMKERIRNSLELVTNMPGSNERVEFDIVNSPSDTYRYFSGEKKFRYLCNKTLAILNAIEKHKPDLVFTTEGLYMIHNDFLWHRTASSCQYKSVLWHNGNKLKIANAKYKNENVNLSKLYKLTQDLGKCLEEQKEI